MGWAVKTSTSSNTKIKGGWLERQVAKGYRNYGIDEYAAPMPGGGSFSHHKADIKKRFDYRFFDECKNHETIKLREWFEIADHKALGNTTVLWVHSDYRPIVAVLREEAFRDLLQEAVDLTGAQYILDEHIVTAAKVNFWRQWENIKGEMPTRKVLTIRYPQLALAAIDADFYFELREETQQL